MNKDKLRLCFIINPHSGVKKKNIVLSSISKYIDTNKYVYEVCVTEYAGHAEELARRAVKDKIDVVVAVGGDGTVNEVARALVHSSTILGIIPCGSGNGLARHLNISTDIKKSIDIINTYQVRSIDYGIINEHPFFCTCGVGFDAYISNRFASSKKRGYKAYVESVLKGFLSYKSQTYDIETDSEQFTCQAFLIACANASQYGNNAYIAPNASLCDGMMDITIVKRLEAYDALPFTIQLFTKKIDYSRRVKRLRCKKIHIHRQNPGIIHYDGDAVNTGKDISVEIIHEGLRMLVGKV